MQTVKQLITRLLQESNYAPASPADVAERALRRQAGRKERSITWEHLVAPRLEFIARKRGVATWSAVEKAGELLSTEPIDTYEATLAEALVWAAAHARDRIDQRSFASTRPCWLCYRTALRTANGLPYCREHLPGRPGRRRIKRLARYFGGESQWHTRLLETSRLISADDMNMLSIDEDVDAIDPAPVTWWSDTLFPGECAGLVKLLRRYAAFKRIEHLARERCMNARVSAGKHGVKGGRPRHDNTEQVRAATRIIDGGASLREAARRVGMSAATLSRRMREADQD